MTKQEFEKRIGAEISQKDYSIVEHVYTWHPSISEVEGKEQIAKLYKSRNANHQEHDGGCELRRDA